MLEKLGQKAIYQIKYNTNRLSFILPKKPLSSEVFIVIAIVSAIIFGLAGRYIPENIKSNILTFGLDIVTEVFMRLLGVFSGLIIFLALINGMCGMGSVSDFSKLGKKIIQRYLVLSFTGGCKNPSINNIMMLGSKGFSLLWNQRSYYDEERKNRKNVKETDNLSYHSGGGSHSGCVEWHNRYVQQ